MIRIPWNRVTVDTPLLQPLILTLLRPELNIYVLPKYTFYDFNNNRIKYKIITIFSNFINYSLFKWILLLLYRFLYHIDKFPLLNLLRYLLPILCLNCFELQLIIWVERFPPKLSLCLWRLFLTWLATKSQSKRWWVFLVFVCIWFDCSHTNHWFSLSLEPYFSEYFCDSSCFFWDWNSK